MRTVICLAAVSLLAFAAHADAGLVPGDRMLVDFGVCWNGGAGDGYGPINAGDYWAGDPDAHGPGSSAASDGNFWNNMSAGGEGGFEMITAAGVMSGASIDRSAWSGCGSGGQVYELDPQSNLYPVQAQTDCRWWAVGAQPGHIYLTGLDTSQTYDVRILSYVSADANLNDAGIPFPAGTVTFGIGASTVNIDPVDNTSTLAEFLAVAPDGAGALTIDFAAFAPADCGVAVNVVDITVTPEPTSMLLLAFGGVAVLRRKR